MYLRTNSGGLLNIAVFIDYIIFEGNNEASEKFSEVKIDFEMSMIGEKKYFLGYK